MTGESIVRLKIGVNLDGKDADLSFWRPTMSTNQDGATCPIRSDFADDPEMAELVEMFVDELGERVEAMSGALGASDWEKLTTLAHQLKGAGGGYGFPTISESAAKLEASLHERSMDDLEMLQSQVDELIGFCRRAAV